MPQSEKNNQLWQWQTDQDSSDSADSSYLTCSLLDSWQHGFFTKQFYPRIPESLTAILQPATVAYRVKQVHGNLVLTAPEIAAAVQANKQNNQNSSTSSFPDADGAISQQPRQSVWAASADCTPILIGDTATGQVCAIHAGWRGTSTKIVTKAIARFLDFGSVKENLRIAIGPAIAGKVYQVDHYVAIELGKTIIDDVESRTDAEILTALEQLPNSPVLPDDLPGKIRLDVPRVNQIQQERLGIKPEQMAIAPYCTYQESDLFFSYRRTGKKQVQWSGIVSN